MPIEWAALFMAKLESCGAVFTFNEHGCLHANLDGVPHGIVRNATQDDVAAPILELAPEIKQILRGRDTQH